MAYIFLFTSVLIPSYFIRLKKTNRLIGYDYEYITIFVLIAILTLFFGLRFNVGIDYMSYYNNAEFHSWNKPQKGTGQLFEPGFRFLYWLMEIFCFPPNTIFILSGSLIYLFLFMGVARYSCSVCASLFAFFSSGLFYFSFNELRQFIAICIVFWGYQFCVEKKILKWIILILGAMMFHQSAFIVFPVYLFSKIHFKKSILNIILFSSLVLKKIGMIDFLCLILSYFPGHYSNYSEVLKYMVNDSGSGIISYLYLSIIFVINNAGWRNTYFNDKYRNFFLNIFLFGAVATFIFSDIYLVVRLLEYLLIAFVIVFVDFIKFCKKSKFLYIFLCFIIVTFFCNIIKYSFFSNSASLLEYQTVFSRNAVV